MCISNVGVNYQRRKYWNKVTYNEVATGVEPDVGETIYSTDRWVCTDDAVASTGAICDKI